ncbi:insulinase family protein [candidate division KSB1 bacterium]|nr:insulinase family protein [candidate division KSB1 bacterium]
MKKLGKYTVGLLVLVSVFCAPPPKVEIPPPPKVKPGVEEFYVNGLQVLLKKVTLNEVISVGLYLKGGTTVITPEQSGIELFLFEAAQKGSQKYPKEELNAALARMGTVIGVNARYDYTGVSLRCIRPHFDESWDILADVILHPTLDSAEVEIVRQRLVTNVKQEKDNPDAHLRNMVNTLFYKDHPYAMKNNGTEQSLSALTRDDLADYHKDNLYISRLLLVVVGNVERSELEAKISGTFAALPQGEYDPPQVPSLMEKAAPDMVTEERDLPTSYIIAYHPAPNPGADDFPAFMLATRILRRRLFEEVRTKRNLTYAVASGHSNRVTNFGYLYVTTIKPDTTIKVMFGDVQKLQSEPIPQKELNDNRNVFLTRYFMTKETNAEQRETYAICELVGKGWEDFDIFVGQVKAITPADIQRVAQTYMHNYHFAILGHPDKVDRELFTSR